MSGSNLAYNRTFSKNSVSLTTCSIKISFHFVYERFDFAPKKQGSCLNIVSLHNEHRKPIVKIILNVFFIDIPLIINQMEDKKHKSSPAGFNFIFWFID